MKIKFWGVRGSIATPLKGDEIKEKKKDAIMGFLSKSQDYENLEAAVEQFLEQEYGGKHTYGGNTTCVEVLSEKNDSYIFDIGTGLREAGLDMLGRGFLGEGKVKIFLSHIHWDHISGFPFFVPAFIPGNQINIYGSKAHEEALELTLKGQSEKEGIEAYLAERIADKSMNNSLAEYALSVQQSTGLFPLRLMEMPSNIKFHYLEEGEVVENGLKVEHHYFGDRKPDYDFKTGEGIVPRHKEGIFSYKITEGDKSFVYATDIELDQLKKKGIVDEEYLEWIKGVDLLYADAQYLPEEYDPEAYGKKGAPTISWGHSTYETIIDYAKEAGVKEIVFGHHEPKRSDKGIDQIIIRAREYANKTGYEGKVDAAYEDMVIDL